MKEIYYKRLIRKYGLWHSPKMTGKIIKEARMYNMVIRKDSSIKFRWKDIAKDIEISSSSISRIVTGKGFPSRKTMDKLIKYLDLVSLDKEGI